MTKPPELPIRATAIGVMAKHMLMVAADMCLIRYGLPVDMTDPDQVLALVGELGPDFPMPEDPDGIYYLFYVDPADDDEPPLPMLMNEGEVPPTLLGIAARRGKSEAYRLQYRASVLPIAEQDLRPYQDGQEDQE